MSYKIYTLSFAGEVRYIGYTKRTLPQRKIAHIQNVQEAIAKKRNWNKRLSLIKHHNMQFEIKLLDEVNILQDALLFEQYWISQFLSWGFRLVNMTCGGEGGDTFSVRTVKEQNITRRRISKKAKGRIRTKETIDKWRNSILTKGHWTQRLGSPMTGKTHSKESRQKMSDKKRGIKINEKVRKARLGILPNNFGKSKYPGVHQIDPKTKEIICTYGSIGEALKALNKKSNYASKIKDCCEGIRNKMCKFEWKYDIVHSVPVTKVLD